MIRNIVINDELYKLNLKNGIHGKSSGVCYHLQDKNQDLAVKIYYNKHGDNDFPEDWEIEIFGEIHTQVLPVVLSQAPVYNEKGDYIGCCSPYLYETKGKTREILYTLPRDYILNCLSRLEETIPVFSENRIELCDWSIYNVMLSEGKMLPFDMHLIDDTFYRLTKSNPQLLTQENRGCLSDLIISIIENHTLNGVDYSVSNCPYFLNLRSTLGEKYDPITYLEKESRGYFNLDDYFRDYLEVQKKKKF